MSITFTVTQANMIQVLSHWAEHGHTKKRFIVGNDFLTLWSDLSTTYAGYRNGAYRLGVVRQKHRALIYFLASEVVQGLWADYQQESAVMRTL